MAGNAYRGEDTIVLDGRPYTLVYDWHALGTLRSEMGSDWSQKLAVAIDETDMPVLARALEIGLARHHRGEWTAERIMDLSPPVNVVAEALNRAIVRAFTGNEPPPEGDDADPPMARLRTLLSRVFGSPARPASTRADSGN